MARSSAPSPRSRTRRAGVLSALTAGALLLAACSSDSSAQPDSSPSSVAGQEITVLLPYKVPSNLLDDFTTKTGVKVNFNVNDWDALHQKLIVALTADTFIADVTEMDWSWVGQFGAAGWYAPLDNLVSPAVLKDLGQTNSVFTFNDALYSTCYSNDIRISLFNENQLRKAGITEFPKTFDQLERALATLKSAGVANFPMTLAMGATEGGVVPWYLLTLAMGGQLFDDQNQPVFGLPGSVAHQALEFEIKSLQGGWVPPGAVTSDDGPAFEKFLGGAASIALSAGPGNLVAANDTGQSSIAPNAQAALVPGLTAPGPTFGLLEGLGIPNNSEHKEAAAAFIDWWQSTDTQVAMYKDAGFLPCGTSGLESLAASGDLQGGSVITAAVQHLVPLFPNGAPPWYPEFSSKAQGLINAAVKGEMSVDDALTQLQEATSGLASGG